MQTAISAAWRAVITLPGDVALRDAVESAPRIHFHEAKPIVCPSGDEIAALAALLNQSKKTTDSCRCWLRRGARGADELAGQTESPHRTCLARQGCLSNTTNPFSVGMTGLLGFSSGYHAMMELRHAPHARNGLPLSAVLSSGRDRHSDRHSRRADWPPHESRFRPCWRRKATIAALISPSARRIRMRLI